MIARASGTPLSPVAPEGLGLRRDRVVCWRCPKASRARPSSFLFASGPSARRANLRHTQIHRRARGTGLPTTPLSLALVGPWSSGLDLTA